MSSYISQEPSIRWSPEYSPPSNMDIAGSPTHSLCGFTAQREARHKRDLLGGQAQAHVAQVRKCVLTVMNEWSKGLDRRSLHVAWAGTKQK